MAEVELVAVLASVAGTVGPWQRSSTDKRQNSVRSGDALCTIIPSAGGAPVAQQAKLSGELAEVCAVQGTAVVAGDVLCRVRPCQHPAILNHMCVACGERVTVTASSRVSALSLNGGQQLQVTMQEAAKVQTSKLSDLQRIKKLALILDLDHTLVHATEVMGPPTSAHAEESVSVLMLEEGPPGMGHIFPPAKPGQPPTNPPPAALTNNIIKHHLLCKRPHLDHFLAEAHKICQLTIYTAGTRRYAESVARVIDPTGKLFSGRMVSRSDIPDDKSSGLEKSLQRLFLGDSSMALIVDDREDVWKGEQASQLLLVNPFHHFRFGREVNNVSGPVAAAAAAAAGAGAGAPAAPIIGLAGPSPGAYLQPDQATGAAPKDDQLLRCLEVIRGLHAQYFGAVAATAAAVPTRPPSMSHLLTAVKSRVLAGCVVTFSGIIPVNEKDPRNHPTWKLAESLGAQVAREVSPRTTHLISVQTQTQKVLQCLQRGDVWVLHPDWLRFCRFALARVREQTFMVTAPEPGKELPNPVLDSSPLTGEEEAAAAVEEPVGAAGRSKRNFDEMNQGQPAAPEMRKADDDDDDVDDEDDDDGFGEDFDGGLLDR